MLVYGYRTKALKTIPAAGQKCPNCNASGTIQFTLYQRYAHAYWIPLIPLGKFVGSYCTQCKQVLEGKEMPEMMRSYAQPDRFQVGTPLYTYSGLALIVLIGLGVGYKVMDDKKQEKAYIQAPQSGDVYEYKQGNGKYSYYKVARVVGSNVYVFESNFEFTGSPDTKQRNSELKKWNFFSKDETLLTQEQVQTMYDKDIITEIVRP